MDKRERVGEEVIGTKRHLKIRREREIKNEKKIETGRE